MNNIEDIKKQIKHHKEMSHYLSARDEQWLKLDHIRIYQKLENELRNALSIEYSLPDTPQIWYISERLDEEANLESKSIQTLTKNIAENACVALMQDHNIIWFISGTKHICQWKHIIEPWSARIDKNWRGYGLWKRTTYAYLQAKSHENIAVLTKTPQMKHILSEYKLQEYIDNDIIWTKLGNTLESTWKLDWYTIYMNSQLKELFETLD